MTVSRLAAASSAPVTQVPERIGLVLVVLAILALATWGMRVGWHRRAGAHADLPAPPDVPADPGATLAGPFGGRYLGTTVAGDWLDRVVAHGLGTPSRVQLTVHAEGVVLARGAAPDVFVPRAELVGARLDKGAAGQAFEDDGVLVLTWRLGARTLDTGVRLTGPDRHAPVVAAVGRLLSTTSPGGGA